MNKINKKLIYLTNYRIIDVFRIANAKGISNCSARSLYTGCYDSRWIFASAFPDESNNNGNYSFEFGCLFKTWTRSLFRFLFDYSAHHADHVK